MSKLKAISESTLVPISMVMTFGAAVFWMATLFSELQQVIKQNEMLNKKVIREGKSQREIDRRLSRIEGTLRRAR